MSWRELGAYIAWLPQESSYRTAVRDSFSDEQLAEIYAANTSEKHGPWSKLELLVTQMIWQVQQLVYIQLLANGAKNAEAPEPIPTPGLVRKRRAQLSDEDVVWLDEIRERNRQAREAG